MEKVDTVSSVSTKELPAKDGKPPLTLYKIFDSQGNEFSTRNRDLARAAYGAHEAGQHVRFDWDEKQGGQFGQFTNRYLNALDIVVDDLGPIGHAVQTAQAAAAERSDPFADTEPDTAPIQVGRDREAEKELSINKAVGLKAGVEVMQYLPAEERTVSNVITAAEYFTTWLQTWRPQ